MKACVVLNENMSKRLIAKGVVATPLVQNALAKGTVLITLGTTNAIVAEEILGRTIDRGAFAAGFIDDRWNINARVGEVGEIVLREGKEVTVDSQELLDSLGAGDLIIKGGNAIDPWGVVGVLTGAVNGGTVGRYLPLALARGVDVVIPIGLAKTIHSSITDLARELGSGKIDRCMGIPCGIFPLVGRVITESDALETLFPVEVTQVANGGVGRGVGSVSLLITGEKAAVEKAFDLVSSLQGEPGIVLEGRA
ncbi:hypothetical protein KAW44_02770 [Candidatus Bipolaricaulota bacterium]|nr:hypothetical protein [Candidatus Bipolaricaulota bacterium]